MRSTSYSAKRTAVVLATTAVALSPSLLVQSFQPLTAFPHHQSLAQINSLALRVSSSPEQGEGEDQAVSPAPTATATATEQQQALETTTTPQAAAPELAAKPAVTKPKKNPDNDGLFAPAVMLTKEIIGITELNKLRGKVIKMHSEVIGGFTETAQSEFGLQVLKVFFTLADKNGDGTIDEEELTVALSALGFDFLKEKEIAQIFKRADGDKNGALDFEEWSKAATPTLKKNLIKMAKKNGHDLGFLAK
mmetsp:Transcript_16026/g.37139  ORF Transcript_16026/g.37139 Transcript_16026/m.37139 type:complete len:249 (+) Transcript_16026:292-1038(+)|eukprot:CAMPEP_0197173682 /NCGR_PEP_ID=MMETSP1423-20130617/517_1 /TAXON_ID=476441 /ORGANISM="Pseudo-nitzschia heimii, Strain UNC1101" /LENGTH=248 /DNA_ID=CAMNT_0042622531 /DNA_START=278 /DNA_END=1024 /DNA_ORIENTATION=-